MAESPDAEVVVTITSDVSPDRTETVLFLGGDLSDEGWTATIAGTVPAAASAHESVRVELPDGRSAPAIFSPAHAPELIGLGGFALPD